MTADDDVTTAIEPRRIGVPPRRDQTRSVARPRDANVPNWVSHLAPYYTKDDFSAIRSKCAQFEAELARSHGNGASPPNKFIY